MSPLRTRGKRIGRLARLQGMGREQDEFADFYRTTKDSCLRAVTAVTGDRERSPRLAVIRGLVPPGWQCCQPAAGRGHGNLAGITVTS